MSQRKSKPLSDLNWYKTAMAILALVGGTLAAGLKIKQLWPSPPNEPSMVHVEVILDRSQGMGDSFEGKNGRTKRQAAQEALGIMLNGGSAGVESNDDLAFRAFGGSCGPQDSQLLFGFGKATSSRIRKILYAANGLAPTGQNSMVHAISEATSDFSPLNTHAIKHIIVITGGGERCDQDIESLGHRLNLYRQVGGVQLDLHYIGLGLSPGDQRKLNDIATATCGEATPNATCGQVTLAQNWQELGKAVYDVVTSIKVTRTPVIVAPHARGIEVVAGTYGQNCGASHGNVTADLASKCNGLQECDYRVDWQVIGDPAVGCGKEYAAEWRCGDSETTHEASAPGEAGYGSVVILKCPDGSS
jgi:hypothetical protein